jgi:GNAT superfamily N-acetyltransferase
LASSAPALPTGFAVRPATLEDLGAIDELYVASERALGIRPERRSTYLRWRWSQPYVDLGRDTRVAFAGGAPAAFGMAFVEEEAPAVLNCMGRVHPDHVDRGLGAWLLGVFEHTARSRGSVTTIRLGIEEADARGHELVTAAGYRRVRSSFDMGVELDGGTAPAPPAPGVSVRAYEPGEERLLWRLEVEAFRDHWDHERDQTFEAFHADWFGDPVGPPRIFVGELGGRPVGVLAWILDHGEPYVFSVAVVRDARRRGVASALLGAAIAAATEEGFREMTLSVDAESPTGAVGLYEKAGMRVLRTLAVYDKDVA